MNCSTPGFPVFHYLPEFAQTPVHCVSDAIQPFHPVFYFSSCPQSFLASSSFPMNQLFISGGQNIGASVSASVLPMNIQGWFPLGLTSLISWLSKELSGVFSNNTIRKHQKKKKKESITYKTIKQKLKVTKTNINVLLVLVLFLLEVFLLRFLIYSGWSEIYYVVFQLNKFHFSFLKKITQ